MRLLTARSPVRIRSGALSLSGKNWQIKSLRKIHKHIDLTESTNDSLDCFSPANDIVIKMDEKMKLVLEMFDIVRMKDMCNVPSCGNKPTKEATIYQIMINRSPKPLVSLYLCDDHVEMINGLMKKFRKMDTKAIFDVEVVNL